ncbi:uncharacterized protein LOC144911542 [Branchiostoma floridae x Branchiostoma belcheri]
MADWETFSELQGGNKVQELGSRIKDRQPAAEDDTTEGGKDIEEEEIEEEIEVEEEEEFPGEQRAEEISVEAGEGEEEVVLMLDDTYEDDFEEDDDDDDDDDNGEDEQPEADQKSKPLFGEGDQESSRAETRKRKYNHYGDDDDDDSGDDKEDHFDDDKSDTRKDETLPRVEDVRNFVETLVGNAVKNLEAEVAARHRQIQESGEGEELMEAEEEESQEEKGEEEQDWVEEVNMEESSSEDESFPELSVEQPLDGPRRDALFEKGLQYQNRGRLEYALKCYLGCLKDLDQTEGFSKLPHCLHQIADTFYRKEEYDKAVQFIQAEKMYYENALIDTSELQKALSKPMTRGQGDIGPPDPRVLRAMEFENLARMCVERKKPQLALEYCGKAVKAYQASLGDDHPATTQCLDYFTVIYAEAGRKEYSDAMGQFQSGQEETTGQLDGSSTLQEGSADLQQTEGATAGEASGVRRRVPAQGTDKKEEETGQVHSEPFRPQVQWMPEEQEDDSPFLVVMVLFMFLVLLVILTYMYCKAGRTSSSFCKSIVSEVYYYGMRLKYQLQDYLPEWL